MKFLCENCKAKYQIADGKVAGKTVRMKCRKCGHMILLDSAVTDTSVASRLPADLLHDHEDDPGFPASPAPTAGAVQAAALGLSPKPAIGALPPRPGPPPRPGIGANLSPGSPGSQARSPAGLAGAFSKAVTSTRDTPPAVSAAMVVLSSSGSAEEWYVGINGVPVGPVRLSDLRRKAATGAVTEDSLVWREGFEEWVPLRTFPELCALLKEAATAYPSLTPPAPTLGAPHAPNRPMPAASMTRATSNAPRAPLSGGARNNVVPIASRRATAEKVLDLDEPLLEDEISFESHPPPALQPFTPSFAPPVGRSASQPPAPMAAPSEMGALMAPAVPFEVPKGDEVQRSRVSARPPARTTPSPFGLVLVVALGGVLVGVGIMFFLPLKATKPPVQIVSVMVPTAPAPPASAAAAEEEGTTTIGPIELAAAPVKAGGKPKAAAAPAAEPGGGTAAPLGPSLSGLNGLVGGPSGPSGGTSTSSGGGQLAAADVERVVQSHRAFVKRQCWDNALSTKSSGAPTSARVVVTVNVARDGNVQGANATGGDTYPGLANCVQGNVKSWKFPASDGATITVPFVFAAQ
jgi:predicted Zn finger-like uncharacterized protein